MDDEQTQIVTVARDVDHAPGARLHCLEFSDGEQLIKRQVVDALGVRIGRVPPADIIFPNSEVSRNHCLVALKDGELFVSDLKSTNGTFVDGERIEGVTALPVGAVLQVGKHYLKHEWRTREEIAQAEELDRELQKAASYVQALLPPMLSDGAVRSDWHYEPSAQLGGDAFGYGELGDGLYCSYLIDVAGHGAGAAMHCVSVMNQLRQKALPGTDMSKPAEVLATLNRMYQMEDHSELYFTMWYGVYNAATRRLEHASAGHHPAFMVAPDRAEAVPLLARNIMIGAVPGMGFKQASIEVPPGASLYLFSDGVFEIIDKQGEQWTIDDFVPLLTQPPVEGSSESQRLHKAVIDNAKPGPLDDDFSLLVLTFE